MSDQKISIPELSLKENILGKWAATFIKRYRITILIMITIIIWGSGNYMSLQREAQPKVTIPFAYVTAIYVGASPEEVETLITEPIEKRLEEIEGVKEITSDSGIGMSMVFLEFEAGEDVDEKVREAKEKLSGIESELPSDAETPEVFDMKTGQSPVLIYTLSGNQDLLELQEVAKRLQKEMELANGVKEAMIIGDIDRQIKVNINPQKLSIYGISIDEINNALASSNVSFPGGKIELNDKKYSVTTPGKFESIDDIENVIVRNNNGNKIYLKDLAEVVDTYEEREVYVKEFSHLQEGTVKSLENTLVLAVLRKESADEVKIKARVEARLDKRLDEILPEGATLELLSDKAEYVDNQLGSVTNNAISGLFIVIIVLFLFIGFREAIIVSLVIPMSLFATFGFLRVTGNTLNEITMFSLVLAVGMLVDNAIVVMENIDRLRKNGLNAVKASAVATNQIAPAIMASTLTTVAAFVPMLFTSGIMGDFIAPIPQTIIITLSCSFFMAITVTPSVCALLLVDHQRESHKWMEVVVKVISIVLVVILSLFAFADFERPMPESFTNLSFIAAVLFGGGMYIKQFVNRTSHKDHPIIMTYANVLTWIISRTHRKLLFIGTVFIIFVICLSMPFVGILPVEMFGGEDMPAFTVKISTPNGSTIGQTKVITEQVENILVDVPEIDNFVSYTGSGGLSLYDDLDITGGSSPNIGAMKVNLIDDSERERTSGEIVVDLRNKMKKIPGADIRVVELQSGPPSGAPIYLKLKGEDLDALEKTADDFEKILDGIDGVRNARTSLGEGSPQLEIDVDKDKAATYGLDEMAIALSVRGAINGITATTFRDGEEDVDVIISTADEALETIYDLKKLKFYNRMGDGIPFSQVAEIIETESVQGISHEDGKRIVHVAADINENKWTAAEALEAFEVEIQNYVFEEGVIMEYGGEFEAMGDSFGDMMMNMVLAALLVYMILAVQFNSLTQPFIILFTVPLSIIGVMLGLLFSGYNFGFVAFIGVVALVGIAVNDAIVLVDYINYLRSEGYEMKEAIKETGVTRFIPVMATTITTAGGILPITLEDPFFAPMGIALIAGLSMATVLTLGVVPTMYSLFEGKRKR